MSDFDKIHITFKRKTLKINLPSTQTVSFDDPIKKKMGLFYTCMKLRNQ